MTSNYETLYGVGFLDDLHNYFPALLYDSSSFGNVRDVLGYIQHQARNRFDLFSYGQREYLSTHPAPVPVRSPASVSASVPRGVVRTSFAGMPTSLPPMISTLLNQPTPVRTQQRQVLINETNTTPSTIQQFVGRTSETTNVPNLFVDIQQLMNPQEEDEEDAEEEAGPQETRQADAFIANALLSLLNLPQTALTRNYMVGPRTMDQFLQPVVVHPTPEQIAQNTTLGNLVSDTEHACAICQDNLTAEQEGRKLNACGHWFHKNCIDTWLERDVHCPVCRHDIRDSNTQTEV